MACLLLLFTLFFYVPINGYFVIDGLRNIQKRSTEKSDDNIEVYSIHINSKVTSRFARNVITSRAVNQANVSKEVTFNVDLPKTAFITNFSMVIDGVTYPGIIKEKEVAQKQYDRAVSRGETAGLVRASGRKTEKFTVSVNVASHGKVSFELVYEEMLKRHLGKYEILIKIQPKALVKNFQIDVDIHEPQGISFLDAQASFLTNDLLSAIKKSFSGEKGHVSFKPTLDQQPSCPTCLTTLLDGDFSVKYEVNREAPGNIQIVNGYFVHFFAPSKLAGVPKNVIFVIDRSGSMSGRKIEQTREALLQILNDTAEYDHLNFILFDDVINIWSNSLVKATPENLEKARQFVKSIKDRAATDINGPLLKAVELLNIEHEMKRVPERSVSLIILLTDGQSNSGETNPSKIQENVKKAIKGRYTLYCLGFGYEVDYPFLEKLALENSGVARRIYEDSDAALQLQGFYTEIANPTLLNIEMQYPANAIGDLTQNSFKHYFDGSEIVVAGRIIDNDLNELNVDVTAEGAEKSLKYSESINIQEKEEVEKQQQYIFGDFTERLWAYLTIQQLLEKRIHANQMEKANLTAEILDLSLKFQFVTPVTSMVVTKPEEKNDQEETLIADKFVEGQSPPAFASAPHLFGAAPARSYPAPRNWVDSDPHFVIYVPQKDDAICFNIQEKPGMVLNLIKDQKLGITINGELIGEQPSNGVISNATFFGKLGIVNRKMKLKIEVTTETVTIMSRKYSKMFTWEEKAALNKHGWNLVINQRSNMTLDFCEGATFFIILHQVKKNYPQHKDFLGFYTVDDHKFSKAVHGLLGQFFNGIDYEISNIHENNHDKKMDATMRVKNNMITVTRGSEKDYKTDPRNGSKVNCWFVHSNGEGLIDGTHTDYIVPDIFTITE